MPIFKGNASKASPGKVMAYVTNPKKAKLVSSIGCNDGGNYAVQFREMALVWGKAQKPESRKYYHFKLSFSPEDNIAASEAHRIALECAERNFAGHQCVLATHTDKAHTHTHIVVNSVNYESGKMLHVNEQRYGEMINVANQLSAEHGFSTVDFRKPAEVRETFAEHQIKLKGGETWKDELREVIDAAKVRILDGAMKSIAEFEMFLERFGVTLSRNTERTISYKHPAKEKPIRGERLGAGYTKGAITDVFDRQEQRTNTIRDDGAVRLIDGAENSGAGEQDGVREHIAEGNLSRISLQVDAVGRGVRQLTKRDAGDAGSAPEGYGGNGARDKERSVEVPDVQHPIQRKVRRKSIGYER